MGRGEGVIENPSAVKDPQVSLESGIFFISLRRDLNLLTNQIYLYHICLSCSSKKTCKMKESQVQHRTRADTAEGTPVAQYVRC